MQQRYLNQQDVNQIAKYIQKKTAGVYKIKFGVNEVDIFLIMYYHTGHRTDPVQEMDLDINMTSYNGKIRFNVTEMNEMENTIVHGVIEVTDPSDLETTRQNIFKKIVKGIEKTYEDYEVIF